MLTEPGAPFSLPRHRRELDERLLVVVGGALVVAVLVVPLPRAIGVCCAVAGAAPVLVALRYAVYRVTALFALLAHAGVLDGVSAVGHPMYDGRAVIARAPGVTPVGEARVPTDWLVNVDAPRLVWSKDRSIALVVARPSWEALYDVRVPTGEHVIARFDATTRAVEQNPPWRALDQCSWTRLLDPRAFDEELIMDSLVSDDLRGDVAWGGC